MQRDFENGTSHLFLAYKGEILPFQRGLQIVDGHRSDLTTATIEVIMSLKFKEPLPGTVTKELERCEYHRTAMDLRQIATRIDGRCRQCGIAVVEPTEWQNHLYCAECLPRVQEAYDAAVNRNREAVVDRNKEKKETDGGGEDA